MNYYEILGPSGSGKTTIFNQLKKNFRTIYFNERIHIPHIIKINELSLSKALIYKILGKISPNRTFDRLTSRLHQISEDRQEKFDLNYGHYYYILENDIKQTNPIYHNQVINDYLSTLKKIHIMEEILPKEHVIVFDEGLIHKNSGLRNESLEKTKIEKLKKDISGLIYLNTPIEIIYEQSLKRQKSKHKTLTHKFLSPNSLKKSCYEESKKYQIFIDRLLQENISILKISHNEPLHKIQEKVKAFCQ